MCLESPCVFNEVFPYSDVTVTFECVRIWRQLGSLPQSGEVSLFI